MPSTADLCSIEGCNSPLRAKGWCNAHYQRNSRHGGPLLGGPAAPRLDGSSTEEKLRRNHTIDPESGCWRWVACHTAVGYGHVWAPPRMQLVHRLAYELWVGPIADGLHVDHVATRGCVHRDCLNPAHLEAVTQQENNRRQMRAIEDRPEPRCVHGHLYDVANTYWHPSGYRVCRACGRVRNAKRKRPVARRVA